MHGCSGASVTLDGRPRRSLKRLEGDAPTLDGGDGAGFPRSTLEDDLAADHGQRGLE